MLAGRFLCLAVDTLLLSIMIFNAVAFASSSFHGFSSLAPTLSGFKIRYTIKYSTSPFDVQQKICKHINDINYVILVITNYLCLFELLKFRIKTQIKISAWNTLDTCKLYSIIKIGCGQLGKKHIIWNDYISKNERFADFINAVIFQGEQLVQPASLIALDSKLWRTDQKKETVKHHRNKQDLAAEEYLSASGWTYGRPISFHTGHGISKETDG